MSASGPPRHLVRRSDLVALGGKAEIRTRARNALIDPSETSAGRFCCDAQCYALENGVSPLTDTSQVVSVAINHFAELLWKRWVAGAGRTVGARAPAAWTTGAMDRAGDFRSN